MAAVANPGPLGLCGFALTTFVLSCYNAGIFGVHIGSPVNVIVGAAVFYGGVAQGLAGMWEFVAGNTFGATAFTSYGAFWLSYAAILIPGFGVVSGYGNDLGVLSHALAIFLLAWTIFTMIMFVASLRTAGGLIALFFCLSLTFLLLTIAEFGSFTLVKRAGGFVGIITAVIAWYNALAGLLYSQESPLLTLPVGKIA